MNVAPLEGKRCRLRPWREDDAEWYLAARDEAVFDWTNEARDLTTEAFCDSVEYVACLGSLSALAIETLDGKLVGSITVAFAGGEAEIAFWLAPQARGCGNATEAVELATRWALAHGAWRVTAQVALGNERSSAVLRRAGFEEIGGLVHAALGPMTVFAVSGPSRARLVT